MGQEIRGLEFTAAQAQAVKTLDQNLAITAGAGSGKTRVLTERYIEILLTELEDERKDAKEVLEKVVAITFTKKAAAEMKERIRERLAKYLSDNYTSVSAKRKKDIINLLDNLSHAKISTMHSFCKRILKDNLFEIGLTTDFEIVQGIEKNNLIRQAVIEAVDEIISNEDHQLYDSLWDLNYRYGKSDLIDLLTEMLEERENIKRFSKEAEYNSVKDKFYQLFVNMQLNKVEDYITNQQVRSKIKELDTFEEKKDSVGSNTVKKISEIGTKLFSLWDANKENDQEQLVELHLQLLQCFYDSNNNRELKIGNKMKKENWVGGTEVKREALGIYKDLKSLLPDAGDPPPQMDNQAKVEVVERLLEIYPIISDKYRALKRQYNYFDFLDLEQQVIETFNNNYHLVEKLRNEIDFMLVDEFQDTNQMQWDIIRPLVTIDKEFTELASGKLFVVGDPKQSIYGFRRADIRIFKEVMQQIEAKNPQGKLELSKNFRSNQALIDFTNYVFEDVFVSSAEAATEYDVVKQDLSFGREVKYQDKINGHPDSHIEVLLTTDQSEDYSRSEYEAQQIAEKIKWLVEESDKKIFKEDSLQSVDYGDIAILMKTRSKLKDYEQSLEQAGIDYITVAGKGYYQRQEIYDLYLALKSLLNPQDDAIVFGLFRSPLFGFSDDQLFRLMQQKDNTLLKSIFKQYPEIKLQFESWQQKRNQISIDQLIDKILKDCGAYASYLSGVDGKQKIANFEKLIEEAAQFSTNEGNNLQAFALQLEDLMAEETREGNKELAVEEEGAVQLMTIHAAKGKEFPVVFLVDLNHEGGHPTGKVICEELNGQEQLGIEYYTTDLKSSQTSSYRILEDEKEAKEQFENKRVFYVGVTRAEEMLFLSTSLKGKKFKNGFKWLMQGLGYDKAKFAEFIAGEEKSQTETLTIDDGEQQRSVEVKLTKNKTAVTELDIELEFEPSTPDNDLNILTEQESEALTIAVETPSSTAEFEAKAETGQEPDRSRENKLYWQEENLATLKGTIIHHGLELLINNGTIDYNYLFRSHPDVEQYSNKKEEIKAELKKIENCPEFCDLTAGQCQTEVDFYLQIEENKFMNGSIDLLTQNQAGEWVVVDWKTNRINSRQDIENNLHEYQSQLEYYERAVQQLKDTENVKTYLYFTDAPAGERLQQV